MATCASEYYSQALCSYTTQAAHLWGVMFVVVISLPRLTTAVVSSSGDAFYFCL